MISRYSLRNTFFKKAVWFFHYLRRPPPSLAKDHTFSHNFFWTLPFNFVLVLIFYIAWHWYNSTLPSKSSWVQAFPLSPPHLCLQLVDVSPQVLHDGQQEVERAVLPFLASTSRFSPPAPGSSLSRSSRGANCSSFTSTVLASAALLFGLF